MEGVARVDTSVLDDRINRSIYGVLLHNPNGLGVNEVVKLAGFAKGTCEKHLSELKAANLVVAFSGKGGKEPNFAIQHVEGVWLVWTHRFWDLKATIQDVGAVAREIKEAKTPELRRGLLLDAVTHVRGRHTALFRDFIEGGWFKIGKGPWLEEADELYHAVQGGYEKLTRRFLLTGHIKPGEINEAEVELEWRPYSVRRDFRHKGWTDLEGQGSPEGDEEISFLAEWRKLTPMQINRAIEKLIEKALP